MPGSAVLTFGLLYPYMSVMLWYVFHRPPPYKQSVGIENRFRHTPGLEQCETQQDRIPDTRPQSSAYVTAEADPLHQDGIDADAHHDKE